MYLSPIEPKTNVADYGYGRSEDGKEIVHFTTLSKKGKCELSPQSITRHEQVDCFIINSTPFCFLCGIIRKFKLHLTLRLAENVG